VRWWGGGPPRWATTRRKTVYVVGKTADGKWAGLKTSVVET
jgi:hypothetical protein